jgi:hypothetical protein
MRIMLRSVVLATATLCATAAFAAEKAVVDIPFNFVNQGHSYPAGKYAATLEPQFNLIRLSSMENAKVSASWVAGPADFDPTDEKLTLKFDDSGNSHFLRTVQLGPRVTSRLDAPSRHHDAGSIATTVNGQ